MFYSLLLKLIFKKITQDAFTPRTEQLMTYPPGEDMKHQASSDIAGGIANQYNGIVCHHLLELNIYKPYNTAITPENK